MLTEQKIPLGQYIAAFVDWLTQHGANYFDAIASTLETMIHGVTFALTWFNPLALIGLIALLAHFIQRKWGLTVFVIASFLLILNLGYWQETMEPSPRCCSLPWSAWSSVCRWALLPRINRCSTP